MPEESTKTAKMSKRFGKMKKLFRLGSRTGSTSQSHSDSPSPSVAPLVGVAAPSSPHVDAHSPVHPDIIVPPVDSASPADFVYTVPTTAPPVNVPPTVTITPEELETARLRAKYTHFRILVIGRANAGKTTLLKRVCNTKEDPVYDRINPTEKRGVHNVHDEFTFKNNPGFIFHDSPGFEAGGKKELEDVLSFIQEKAKSKEVKDQIHVIWFCFEPDVSRPLSDLESTFFNNPCAGNVPVVAIFTKFDVLITKVYDRNKDEEENLKFACLTLMEKFEKPLRGYKYPPCAYAQFESIYEDEGNHQEQVGELIKKTTASMDNLALKMLFVTVQQNNLEVCIDCAVATCVFENYDLVGHFVQLQIY